MIPGHQKKCIIFFFLRSSREAGLATLGHLRVVVHVVHLPVASLLGLLVGLLLLLHVDGGLHALHLHVAHAELVERVEAVGGGHHGGGHTGRDVAGGDVVIGRGAGAGDVGVDVGVDVGGPGVDVAARRGTGAHGDVVLLLLLAVVGQGVVLGRAGEGRHAWRGDGGRGGVDGLLVGGGGRVGARGHAHAHALAEAGELVLEGLVAAEEVLDGAVAVVVAAQLLELVLETLNVLLGAGADGALGLAVVGALAGELGGSEG